MRFKDWKDPFDKYLGKCTSACRKKGIPQKGDTVYVWGDDDITDGKTKVSKVFHVSNAKHFISIAIRSNIHQIAWEGWLKPEQHELKKRYGNKKACLRF